MPVMFSRVRTVFLSIHPSARSSCVSVMMNIEDEENFTLEICSGGNIFGATGSSHFAGLCTYLAPKERNEFHTQESEAHLSYTAS